MIMSDDLVIAQVTDMHIGESKISYRGIEGRQQFLNVLQVLAEKPLDLMVLSGDLVAIEGEPEGYAWIKQTLTTFPHPYVVMAGNHDHVMRMKTAFDLADSDISQSMLCFGRRIKERRLLFLDSSSDRLGKQQLGWLTTQLSASDEPVLLFIHHPPSLCECHFMDKYHVLHNIDEIWQVLDQFPQVRHIFCGHYHAEKTVVRNGKFIHLTPATIFQIDTESHDFVIEHTKPGWRIIEWKEEEEDIQTYVEYYDEQRQRLFIN